MVTLRNQFHWTVFWQQNLKNDSLQIIDAVLPRLRVVEGMA